VLDRGKVMQIGSPQDIYRSPANVFVATFIGSPPMNLVEDGATWLGFRPEEFLPREVEEGGDLHIMPLRVMRVEYLGADRLVYGVIEGREPETHVISKIPTNIRAEVAGGELHEFAVRRSDLVRFDRATSQRIGGGQS
jgi:multiple sugar transport system ATP-binding protein